MAQRVDPRSPFIEIKEHPPRNQGCCRRLTDAICNLWQTLLTGTVISPGQGEWRLAASRISSREPIDREVMEWVQSLSSAEIQQVAPAFLAWYAVKKDPWNLDVVRAGLQVLEERERADAPCFADLMVKYNYNIKKAMEKEGKEKVQKFYNQRKSLLEGLYIRGYNAISLQELQECGLEPLDSQLQIPGVFQR